MGCSCSRFRGSLRSARCAAGPTVLALALLVPPGTAQTLGTMPGTLRYGSGLLDIPVALVLPHLALTATWSAFRVSAGETVVPDGPGESLPPGQRYERWFSDGSLALGLFDRLELGATLQHFAGADRGGKVLGAFGRLALLRPRAHGIGLAGGFRYLTSPSFADRHARELQPNRLGYPDWRVTGDGEFGGNLSPYVVGTAVLPGFATGSARHDVTLHLGWGGGLFSAGKNLEFYGDADSGGIFAGAAVHLGLGGGLLLNLMAEFNGFDANAGMQLDLGGIRAGVFALGLQHDGTSTFRSRKFGVLGSVAFCGGRRTLCRGERRPAPDTVTLPAPPPDTVVIVRAARPGAEDGPEGTAETLCLATGIGVEAKITAAGDTLVGPTWVSIGELRPGLVFAGNYAEGREWFIAGGPVRFENHEYARTDAPVRLSCDEIVQIGQYGGVPVFGDRSAEPPFESLHVPFRPGIWSTYRRR